MPNGLPPDVNDRSIPDGELLYIRIFPDPDFMILDTTTGQYRPRSGALKKSDGPLSVDLGSRCTPEETRDRDQSYHFHVAAFTAGTARQFRCRIVRDPQGATPNHPANPAHALVFGNHESGNGSLVYNSQCRPIAHVSRIVLFNDRAPSPTRRTEET